MFEINLNQLAKSLILIVMERALVLMIVEPSEEKEVMEKLKTYPEVIEAHFIYGPYDVYVKIEVETLEEIQQVVLDKIRNIPGIRSTMTCFLANFFEEN